MKMGFASKGSVLSRVLLSVVAGGFVAGGLGGCLNQSQYDRVRDAYASCEARTKELEREKTEAQLALDQLRNSYGKGEGTLASLQKENADLRAQLDRTMGEYRGMQDRIAGLQFGPLDPTTSNDLTTLAGKYSNLIAFDAQRGMLRIASDLSFDSGSAQVKASAQQALRELATILNSSTAAQYDVVVEGHTDSQRMASQTTLREHKSNRGLSVHRSVSVIDELQSSGVAPQRLMAAGWGEYRPAVANNANGNTPQNRRVEIFLAKLNNASATNTTPNTERMLPSGNNQANVPDDNIK